MINILIFLLLTRSKTKLDYFVNTSITITNMSIEDSHALTVCQWPAADLWFSPCNPCSSANKADRHDIAEILLKVELNTINQTKPKMLIVSILGFPVGPITFFMFSVRGIMSATMFGLFVLTSVCFIPGSCFIYVISDYFIQHDSHRKWCSCRLAVTRRVPLVEHFNYHPDVSGFFCVIQCRSLFILSRGVPMQSVSLGCPFWLPLRFSLMFM